MACQPILLWLRGAKQFCCCRKCVHAALLQLCCSSVLPWHMRSRDHLSTACTGSAANWAGVSRGQCSACPDVGCKRHVVQEKQQQFAAGLHATAHLHMAGDVGGALRSATAAAFTCYGSAENHSDWASSPEARSLPCSLIKVSSARFRAAPRIFFLASAHRAAAVRVSTPCIRTWLASPLLALLAGLQAAR